MIEDITNLLNEIMEKTFIAGSMCQIKRAGLRDYSV